MCCVHSKLEQVNGQNLVGVSHESAIVDTGSDFKTRYNRCTHEDLSYPGQKSSLCSGKNRWTGCCSRGSTLEDKVRDPFTRVTVPQGGDGAALRFPVENL